MIKTALVVANTVWVVDTALVAAATVRVVENVPTVLVVANTVRVLRLHWWLLILCGWLRLHWRLLILRGWFRLLSAANIVRVVENVPTALVIADTVSG